MTTHDELDPRDAARLRAAIDQLPEEVEPARDLWTGIRARIEQGRVASLPGSARHPFEKSPWYTVPRRLAAAAVLLVAISSTVTWAVATREAGSVAGTQAQLDSARVMMDGYERSAAELSALLDQRSAKLDPETRAMLERTLRTIDGALAEAREALTADPSNPTIRAFVASAYKQKIDFLRRANDVASELGG